MNWKLPSMAFALFITVSRCLAEGEGTIGFANSTLTRMQFPPSVPLVFGVFVVSSNDFFSSRLILPLGTSSTTTAGIITVPNGSAYPITGTTPGETVLLQVKAWPASFGTNWQAARELWDNFRETDIRWVTLGPSTGPGTVIWQSATGTNPNRFPVLSWDGPLTPPGPFFLVNDPMIEEGSGGYTHAVFSITLSYINGTGVTTYPKTVGFSTRSGTAVAGQDFVGTNGILTFAEGVSSRTVIVPILPDAIREAGEQFTLELSNPVNAWNLKSIGNCQIVEARINHVRFEGGHSAVTFPTLSARRYAVEFTTNWTTWNLVEGADDLTGVGSPVTVSDTNALQSGARFYRTRLLTP